MSTVGCRLCGSTTNKMSREDMYHKGWEKLVPRSPEIVQMTYTTMSTDSKVREIPHSMYLLKTGGVCKICNESWMNQMDRDIEDVVLALANRKIQSVPTEMVPEFAAWASKVALMRAEVDRSIGGQAHPQTLRDLERRKSPPPRTVVRFGLTTELIREGGSNGFYGPTVLGANPEAARQFELSEAFWRINVVSWNIGYLHVNVLVVSRRAPSVIVDRIDQRIDDITGMALRRIWPNVARSTVLSTWLDRTAAENAGEIAYIMNGVPPRPIPPRSDAAELR